MNEVYVVLETAWEENTCVVVDEEGNTKLFYSQKDADVEAEECQQGQVVRIR